MLYVRGVGLGCLACRPDGEGLLCCSHILHDAVCFATMAAKKKSTDGNRGINKDGKIVGFTPVKAKPTEAITAPGQKATGLAKPSTKDRFASTAKTPVVNNPSGATLRGSGTPLGTSIAINPLNKSQMANAALTILGTKGSGQVTKAVTGKVGKFVSEHTFSSAARGLESATGQGGKIKNVMTPFGKTVAGTKVGSAAEQSSRIENLFAAADKTARIAGASAAKEAKSVLGTVGQATRTAAAGAVANSTKKKMPKKK